MVFNLVLVLLRSIVTLIWGLFQPLISKKRYRINYFCHTICVFVPKVKNQKSKIAVTYLPSAITTQSLLHLFAHIDGA